MTIQQISIYMYGYETDHKLLTFSKSVLDIKTRLVVTVELGKKMDAKFGFCIKFYARIQIFRLLGPTKLFFMAI